MYFVCGFVGVWECVVVCVRVSVRERDSSPSPTVTVSKSLKADMMRKAITPAQPIKTHQLRVVSASCSLSLPGGWFKAEASSLSSSPDPRYPPPTPLGDARDKGSSSCYCIVTSNIGDTGLWSWLLISFVKTRNYNQLKYVLLDLCCSEKCPCFFWLYLVQELTYICTIIYIYIYCPIYLLKSHKIHSNSRPVWGCIMHIFRGGGL